MKRALLCAVVLVALAGCAETNPSDAGTGAAPALPHSDATMNGTIMAVNPFVPVTTDCVPPDEVDPNSAVSSDDPPICTEPSAAPLGTILVEARPGTNHGDKISFTINRGTALFVQSTDSGQRRLTEVGFDALTKLRKAHVGFSGPVMDSYPQQTTADSVVLMAN